MNGKKYLSLCIAANRASTINQFCKNAFSALCPTNGALFKAARGKRHSYNFPVAVFRKRIYNKGKVQQVVRAVIRRVLMDSTQLDEWLMAVRVRCIYMHIAELGDNWNSDPHAHEYNEICYVARGSGLYVIDGVEYSMKTGDLFFLPKGCKHKETGNPSDPYELRFIMLENNSGNTFELDRLFFSKPHRMRSSKPQQVRRIWDQILEEIVDHDEGYLAVVESSMKTLYTILYREICNDSSASVQSQSESRSNRREFLSRRLHDYVIENIARCITVDEIAAAFHYHPKYLTTLVKQETGMTLTAYILSVRLECVCELLSKTQYSIANIITMCGFRNDTYFYRVFKQEMGMTPVQYRSRYEKAPRDTFPQ